MMFIMGDTGIPEIIDYKTFITSAVIPNVDFESAPVYEY